MKYEVFVYQVSNGKLIFDILAISKAHTVTVFELPSFSLNMNVLFFVIFLNHIFKLQRFHVAHIGNIRNKIDSLT